MKRFLVLPLCSMLLCTPAQEEKEPKVQKAETKPAGQDTSWLSRYDVSDKKPLSFKLPGRISEASGLAMSEDGKLFCHDDERGVVYQLDYRTGKIVKQFSVGAFTISGDFEGIAVKEDTMFLVASNGDIVQFREAKNDEHVSYQVLKTRLTAGYDVEGLEYDAETDCLLLACKGYAGKGLSDYKAVYSFSLKTRTMLEKPRFLISLKELKKGSKKKKFNPSGIARHPTSGTFFIVAAEGRSVIEIDSEGNLLAQEEIPKKTNRQPEGITFAPDLTMIICNDGQGGRGTLTMYPLKK
ncbi:MAG: hypothetical protein O7D34_01730 [Ignavibacteria bacterium]|nr:hypothetical protein [Ignavibacteria bacterium]